MSEPTRDQPPAATAGPVHSQAELASLANAAATGKGGCWVVVGVAGPFYAGLHREPAPKLVEAVLTVTAPARSRIVLASNPGHHVPALKIEPRVTWGHQRVLWKLRGDLGVEPPPAPEPADDDDDVLISAQFLRGFVAKGTSRFIANHDGQPWTHRLHDLLSQAEEMCGKSDGPQTGAAVPAGQGLLIIDDGYLVDGLTAEREPPTDQERVRVSQRFCALPALAERSGTMVVVLTASEPRARGLLGIFGEGESPDDANLLCRAITENALNTEQARHLREQARAYPILQWTAGHLVRWPSGKRSQPYGEMLRPANLHEPVYSSLHRTAPAALPSPVQKLDRMIAMDDVRQTLHELEKSVKRDANRRRKGLTTGKPPFLHASITGPTGTGKTTVAGIIAEIYSNLNLLGSSQITTVTRGDLVGEHVGTTAIKTRNVCTKALGGVLFIDEAYSLAQGGETDFGKEAVAELLLWMVNYRDRLAVIFAGYEEDMAKLWAVNQGLLTRIPASHHFKLRGYTDKEVAAIVAIQAAQENETLTPDTAAVIEARIAAHRAECTQTRKFGNGRVAEMLLQAAQRARDARISAGATAAELRTLLAVDFANARFG